MKKLLPLCFLLSINFTISRAQVILDTIGAGGSLQFNGSSGSYVNLGNIYKTVNFPFTVEAWIYPTKFSTTSGGGIFSTDNDTNAYYGFWISEIGTSGQIDVGFGNSFGFGSQYRRGVNAVNPPPLNQWTHLTVVCTSVTNVKIYFNGVEQTTEIDDGGSGSTTMTHSNSPANIGRWIVHGTENDFNGQIDEVRLWNDTLSQLQIRQNMCEKINGSSSGLIGYWRADEADTALSVKDYSSSNIKGKIVGSVTRDISDAPLGNSSSYLYSSNFGGQAVRCGATNGDSLIVSQITGAPNGVQIYVVNSSPYYKQGLQLAPGNYFGVFCIGGTSSIYTATYHYKIPDGLINITNQDSATLSIRTDATDTPWTFLGGALNTTQQTITKTNQNAPNEYILSLKGNYTSCGLLNIVNNPGFENYRALPYETNQLNLCDGWSNCNGYYGGQTCSSPDFLSTKGSGYAKIPYFADDTVYPHSGNGIADFVTYNGGLANYREYIRTYFTTPMVVGKTYTVSFYLTSGKQSNLYNSNNVGVLFTKDSSLTNCLYVITSVTPQINITSVIDTEGWKLFSFQYTADSAYNYITIGNFYDDGATKLQVNPHGITHNPYAQFFIDDISVSISSNVNTSISPASDTLCSGTSLTLKASGGTSYVWSTSATTDSIVVKPTKDTIYTVNVSSGNCVGTDTAKIAVNPVPVISIAPSLPQICSGQIVQLTGSGAVQYQWRPSTGLSVTTGSFITANPTITTTYTLIGSNSFGCSDSTKVVVTVNPLPILIITPSSPQICIGQSTSLVVKGAAIYSWNPSTGLTTTLGSSTTANPTVTTTYTAYGISTSGCNDSAKVTVKVNPLPVLVITPPDSAICRGYSAALLASGASTYKWSPSSGLSSTANSRVIAEPTITTTYKIIGTSSSGCIDSTTAPIRVVQDSLKVSTNSTSVCQGNSVVLTASGDYGYSWSPSTGLNITTGDTVTATPFSTTTYTLIGMGPIGCQDTQKVAVTVNLPPNLTITPTAPQICIGQSASLIVKGAATYHWSPSTGLTATSGSSTTATPTVTTTYTAYGTSFLGCNDSAKVTVKVNPLPVLIITPPDTALCRGYSASLKASGASVYKWSPLSGLSSVTNSTVIAKPTITTTYKLTGTSSSGCIDSTIISIRVVQDSLKASITDTSVCQGNSAVLTASADYGYTWSPSTGLNQTTGSSVTATPTLTTSYTLIGTGPIGCLDTQKVVVNIYLPPVLAITPPSPQICIGHPVELNVSGASIYHWSPSSGLSLTTGSSVSANPVVLTTYTAYGTDVHGCNDSAKVSVIVNLLPIVTIAPLDSIVCNGLSVPLTVRGTSSYRWSPAAGLSSTTDSNVVAAPLATTTYTVYGTDNLGCVDTVSAIVKIIPNTIVITVIPTNSIICLGNAAFIEATGGTHYSWSPSVGINATTGDTLTANPISTTTYTVIGTGLGDCADTTVAIIVVSPPPVITVEPASPVMCYGQAMPLTASGAATYEWIPSTGLYETSGSAVDAHSVVTTNYTVYGTDSLFCNDSTKFTLTVKPSPVSSFTTAVPSICDPLQIQFSNTSTDGVSYFWNFGDGDTSTEQNPAHLFPKTGIYTITLISTSENGCMDTLITADTLTNGHSNLFVANSFTPSIQGMNQTFKPDIVCTAPSNYFLKIYDRWGVTVFESDDPTIGWDGTYKGKPQPLGTYVYYLQVNCGICTYSNKGDLTLIR